MARAPIPMFRHGLGLLFGRRLVVLEHRGRTTGLPRHVVLEVIASEPDRLTVVSGYGFRSQWYRNILADPHVRVWTGRTLAAQALASAMPAAEAVAMLEDYRDRHRRAARALGKVLSIPDLTPRWQAPTRPVTLSPRRRGGVNGCCPTPP